MVEEGLFLNVLKSMKSESEPLTVIPLSDVMYLSAKWIFLESFDIRCIVFKLHPYFIIGLLDLLSTC